MRHDGKKGNLYATLIEGQKRRCRESNPESWLYESHAVPLRHIAVVRGASGISLSRACVKGGVRMGTDIS